MTGIARHTPVLSGDYVIRAVSIDAALLPHVGDALFLLTLTNEWLDVGDSISDIVEKTTLILEDYYSNMLIGMVANFLVDVPPGWLLLDGATHEKDDYPELWALLDEGIKTVDDFTLPDMTDAFLMGVQTTPDTSDTGGENTLNLTVAQLPSHTHTYIPPVLTVEAETPTTPIPTAGIGSSTDTGATGSGDDIENRPQYVTMQFAIFAGRA